MMERSNIFCKVRTKPKAAVFWDVIFIADVQRILLSALPINTESHSRNSGFHQQHCDNVKTHKELSCKISGSLSGVAAN